jgi:hypothetical protein
MWVLAATGVGKAGRVCVAPPGARPRFPPKAGRPHPAARRHRSWSSTASTGSDAAIEPSSRDTRAAAAIAARCGRRAALELSGRAFRACQRPAPARRRLSNQDSAANP